MMEGIWINPPEFNSATYQAAMLITTFQTFDLKQKSIWKLDKDTRLYLKGIVSN